MNSVWITLIAGPLLSAPVLAQLDWDYVDKRSAQTREVIEQGKRISKPTVQDNSKERAAYAELGKALATHPAMQQVNTTEAAAQQQLQRAQRGGNTAEISLAQQELALAKTARFQKAASIPDLKKLIDAWQLAALAPPPADESEPEPELEANMQSISARLGELLKATGK